MALTTLHTEYGRMDQSLVMTTVARRSDDKRFRVRIRRNAYDHQSHAIAEVWTANGWTEVTRRLDFASLKVAEFSYVHKGETWHYAADTDARALMKLAMELVP
jgi:hypothetical protein